jgi:hypothetical protein
MYARTSSRVGRWRDRKWACLWPRCVPDLPIAGDRFSSLAIEMPRLEFAYGSACRRQDSPPRHVGRSGKERSRSMSLMSATGAWSDCGDRRPWTDMTVCYTEEGHHARGRPLSRSLLGIAVLVLARVIGYASCNGWQVGTTGTRLPEHEPAFSSNLAISFF